MKSESRKVRSLKFDQYLNGMVELRVPASYTEEVLQQLTGNGVHVYQVYRKEENVYLTIHLDDFSMVQHLLRGNRCRFHVQQRFGLPFVISRLKRRRGLLLGVGLGFAMVYLLLSFIWGYEVIGNSHYSDEHLIALVQEYGVIPGSRSDKFDYDEIASQMVVDHPEFTWIKLEPSGTTLQITVKERLADSSKIHKTGSLVARTDGRVTELLVFRGTPLVEKGDWVTKGQVLVGGWDYPDRQRDQNGEFGPVGEPFVVEAQAVISGEQERRVIGSCALEERSLNSTGREQKQVALAWRGHQLIIWGPKESPYRYASQNVEQKSLLEWKRFHLPVYVKTTVFAEKKSQKTQYTEQEAYDLAVERARKRLQEQMPDGSRFLHESIGMLSTKNKTAVQAEVVWLVEENLAQMEQRELPPTVQIKNADEQQETDIVNDNTGNQTVENTTRATGT